MNAQERQLIDDLFDRLTRLEQAPRDAGAESAIRDGLRRAPNAVYALVQTVLVQDEALKRANAHIEEIETQLHPQAQQVQSGGFLDSMRDALFGSQQNHGTVPNVRPQDAPRSDPTRPIWNSGQVNAQVDPRYAGGPGYGSSYGAPYGSATSGGGGSFLGTAAAAAAGVIGGSLLMGGIRNLMGGRQAFADQSALGSENRTPRTDQSDSTLAHDAGIDDIGRGGDNSSRQGLFDQASTDDDNYNNNDGDFDNDDDGFDPGGDSDVA